MMSLSEIIRLNKEASKKVKKTVVPYCFPTERHIVNQDTFAFPYLGDKVPKGWELLEDPKPLFADSTGVGLLSEPALTHSQLEQRLLEIYRDHPEYGYAIIESGPFQVYIGVFKRHYKGVKTS